MKHRKTISHGMAPRDRLELFGYPVDDAPNLTHRRRMFHVTRIAQMVVSGGLLIASLVVIHG